MKKSYLPIKNIVALFWLILKFLELSSKVASCIMHYCKAISNQTGVTVGRQKILWAIKSTWASGNSAWSKITHKIQTSSFRDSTTTSKAYWILLKKADEPSADSTSILHGLSLYLLSLTPVDYCTQALFQKSHYHTWIKLKELQCSTLIPIPEPIHKSNMINGIENHREVSWTIKYIIWLLSNIPKNQECHSTGGSSSF